MELNDYHLTFLIGLLIGILAAACVRDSAPRNWRR